VPLLLARIDDRLIHGQVAHGWVPALRATFLAIVSDTLRSRPADADLYLLAAPEGTQAAVRSVEEALEAGFGARVSRERSVLLFPGPEEPFRLREGGFPLVEVNVGGLHFAHGKREILPYVFLDDREAGWLAALAAAGVRVVAQDLPTNPARDLVPLLGRNP
jgi:mannose/fructose/N-acetylgalactosamine-specific phosphotransferase system component IIB